MNWLQIELPATPGQLPPLEQALLDAGAAAVSLVSDADEPVLEPEPGETPLWSHVRVRALFELDADMTALKQNLARVPDLAVAEMGVEFLGESDWQAAARAHAVDQVFAGRLRLLPKPEGELPTALAQGSDQPVRLYLEPGMAFGSGAHPTTNLCLQWLAQHVQAGSHVLDFGCGSGVLGIGAALLGANVVAVDHDAQAVMASAENAAYNSVPLTAMTIMHTEQWRPDAFADQFDVVVANILARPLCELSAMFVQVARSGAQIVLSGVLAEQASEVMSHYPQVAFEQPAELAGWVRLNGTLRK